MFLGLPLVRESVQTKSRDYGSDDDEDEDTGLDYMTRSSAYVQSSHLMELDLGDPKTELFLADPEKSMKVFFSSHFRTQGNF